MAGFERFETSVDIPAAQLTSLPIELVPIPPQSPSRPTAARATCWPLRRLSPRRSKSQRPPAVSALASSPAGALIGRVLLGFGVSALSQDGGCADIPARTSGVCNELYSTVGIGGSLLGLALFFPPGCAADGMAATGAFSDNAGVQMKPARLGLILLFSSTPAATRSGTRFGFPTAKPAEQAAADSCGPGNFCDRVLNTCARHRADPSVSSVTPALGPTGGGVTLTLDGANFVSVQASASQAGRRPKSRWSHRIESPLTPGQPRQRAWPPSSVSNPDGQQQPFRSLQLLPHQHQLPEPWPASPE